MLFSLLEQRSGACYYKHHAEAHLQSTLGEHTAQNSADECACDSEYCTEKYQTRVHLSVCQMVGKGGKRGADEENKIHSLSFCLRHAAYHGKVDHEKSTTPDTCSGKHRYRKCGKRIYEHTVPLKDHGNACVYNEDGEYFVKQTCTDLVAENCSRNTAECRRYSRCEKVNRAGKIAAIVGEK